MIDRGVEILGFQHPGGYLPYAGGLLTIYGQNGAGKSLLLESIESSLTGRYVGRTKPNSFEQHGEVSSAAIVRTTFTALDYYAGRDVHENIAERLLAALRAADSAVYDLKLASGLQAAWNDLYREFAEGEYVVIAPAGSTDSRWVAYASTQPGGLAETNWAAALDAHVLAAAEKAGAPDGDLEDAYAAWNEDTDEEWTLQDQTTNLNGVITDGGILKFNPFIQPMVESPFGKVITDGSADPQGATAEWLEAVMRHHGFYGREDEQRPPLEDVAATLESQGAAWAYRANGLLADFLLDPPPLRLAIGGPIDWVSGQQPHWVAGPDVAIKELSDGERRWSRIAIALSAPDSYSVLLNDEIDFPIDEDSDLPAPLLLLDEPERGLHRSAEAHLAAGLLARARTERMRPILATHSPALLDAGQGQIFQIKKRPSGGIGAVKELLVSEVDDLKSVGLAPSSLLHLDKAYVLVEGEHDKQILEGWFAPELRDLRVAVLAMHGTRNLWTVFDSEFLVERSDALLIPLLDDIAIDPLYDLWAQASAHLLGGKASKAAAIVHNGLARIPGGGKDIYGPLLTGAIKRGVGHRFFPLGMAKKDVLEYLPVDALVGGATSWPDLRKEYNRTPTAMADRSGKAYKDWLRKVKRADLTPENLRWVAETTAPHPDIKAVIARVADRMANTESPL